MKSISAYITEGIFKNIGVERPKPRTTPELVSIIIDTIMKDGPECDLNFIDTSLITDMDDLFSGYYDKLGTHYTREFNGDISNWNVSNVNTMAAMFANSKFNGDISKWNVSKVKDMYFMFACSQFNGDISKWNVSKVTNMSNMFMNSQFTGNISKWNVSKVSTMYGMFKDSKFNGDISKWDVSNVNNMAYIFAYSNFNQDLSAWDVSKMVSKNIMGIDGMFIKDYEFDRRNNLPRCFIDSPKYDDIIKRIF